MLITLERLRGLIAASKIDQTPVVDLLFNGEGFELGCKGQFVKNSRGDRRVFRTSDAALRYVRENLSRQLGRSVDVLVHVAAGLL